MLIRYPGSKDKHLKLLEQSLETTMQGHRKICEPFSGTASITFHLLKKGLVDFYWINDLDEGMVALWETVKNEPDELVKMIENYEPNLPDFYEFKANKIDNLTTLDKAFRKLVLHQVSFSGMGAKAGGPLGGKEQKSAYKIDCRWSPRKLTKDINQCSTLLNSAEGKFTSQSWDQIFPDAEDYFLYLDPPYYVKGPELYIHGGLNHENLAYQLSHRKNWFLSYDDAPQVRELYSWANIQRVDVLSHLHHKIINDVAITPKP